MTKTRRTTEQIAADHYEKADRLLRRAIVSKTPHYADVRRAITLLDRASEEETDTEQVRRLCEAIAVAQEYVDAIPLPARRDDTPSLFPGDDTP